MANAEIREVAGARESRAFFAALLAACRSDCTCQTCEILRQMADSMAREFTPKGERYGKAKAKV